MGSSFASKRLITSLILFLIGISLIVYFFYPSPTPPKLYSYGVKVYDALGAKLSIPAKNITVVLQGITFKDFNETLSQPNLGNSTYYFENLKPGEYLLKIYSSHYNILLVNRTVTIEEDKIDTITLDSQTLSVSVNIGSKPSKFAYGLSIKNKDKGFIINGTIKPESTFVSGQLPLGNYSITLYYLGLEINKTDIKLNGTIAFFTFNTYVVNATFALYDSKGNLLKDTRLYLQHDSKSIGPFISSSNGLINATNIPPLSFKAIFNYKGTNVTLKEDNLIDLSQPKNKIFNYTTYLGNLTLYVKYEDGTPAKGLHASVTPLVGGILGAEGNATFSDIPANKTYEITVDDTFIIVLKRNVTIKPEFNNITLIIPKYNLNLTLKGKNDISKFKIYFIIQNNFNKSIVMKIVDYKLNLQLNPGIYRIFAYVYSPINDTLLIYSEYLALNKTIEKSVDVNIGYSVNVNTSSADDVISLYYISNDNRNYLINKSSGNNVVFSNLVYGNYKIVVIRDGKYIASYFLVINDRSPSIIYVNIDTTPNYYLIQNLQYGMILLLILLFALFITSFLIYKSYKKKKESK